MCMCVCLCNDSSFSCKWLKDTFLKYLDEWEAEVKSLRVEKREQSKMLLSKETREGLQITGTYFTIMVIAIKYNYVHPQQFIPFVS